MLTSWVYAQLLSQLSPVELASVFTGVTTIAHALIFCCVYPTYLLQKMRTIDRILCDRSKCYRKNLGRVLK